MLSLATSLAMTVRGDVVPVQCTPGKAVNPRRARKAPCPISARPSALLVSNLTCLRLPCRCLPCCPASTACTPPEHNVSAWPPPANLRPCLPSDLSPQIPGLACPQTSLSSNPRPCLPSNLPPQISGLACPQTSLLKSQALPALRPLSSNPRPCLPSNLPPQISGLACPIRCTQSGARLTPFPPFALCSDACAFVRRRTHAAGDTTRSNKYG